MAYPTFSQTHPFNRIKSLLTGICSGVCACLLLAALVSADEKPSSELTTERQSHNSQAVDLFKTSLPVKTFSFETDEDRDYDKQPDDWTRRKGEEFRQYVHAEIDYRKGAAGRSSLRMDANGSAAAYYSPPIPVDALHNYTLEASLLTQGLHANAAVVSFSFLNNRKQRIQRVTTAPVSGDHKSWVNAQLPLFQPDEEVRFVVVGCHLIGSGTMDIRGTAWFDNIRIGKLPRLDLINNFGTHFRKANSEITVSARASGLDPGETQQPYQYELKLQSLDVSDQILHEQNYLLSSNSNDAAESEPAPAKQSHETVWTLPVYPHGYYRVQATLLRNQSPILQKSTSFAVMSLVGRAPETGEFGWSIINQNQQSRLNYHELKDIANEAGINWVKVPVWQQSDPKQASELGEFLTSLQARSIASVGMLSEAPLSIRKKYSEDWQGVSEVFTSPPAIWKSSIHQVMAAFSPTISHWQLGDDTDLSFSTLPNLQQNLLNVRHELQRVGQVRQLGFHWSRHAPILPSQDLNRNFLSLVVEPFEGRESQIQLRSQVKQIQSADQEAWLVVKPELKSSQPNPHQRAHQFVKQLVIAKSLNPERIFAWNILDQESGILNADGSPAELFLPWRTTALALNNSRYAGSIQLPGRSENHVFFREHEAVIVIWNSQETVEEIYLGDHVTEHTVWGAKQVLSGNPTDGRSQLQITSAPMILTGCSLDLMRWRMGIQFEKGGISNSQAQHEDRIQLQNPHPWQVQGTVRFLPENGWEVLPTTLHLDLPPQQQVSHPIDIKLPAYSYLGGGLLVMELDLTGSGISYPFRAYYDYLVGRSDVNLDVTLRRTKEGGLLVEQILTNQTEPAELLDFRCYLFTRGNRRQIRNLAGLSSGQTRKIVYLIPEFDKLPSKELWLRAEQKNGQRLVNTMLSEEQVQRLIEQTERESNTESSSELRSTQ